MRINKRYVAGLVMSVVIGTIGSGCTTYPEPPPPPPQTDILRVEKEPNPVATGDTATFTCVIEDSTDERFRFYWTFHFSADQDTVTKENKAKWIAPDTSGVFNHGVTVNNGVQDSMPPGRSFNIEVVDR